MSFAGNSRLFLYQWPHHNQTLSLSSLHSPFVYRLGKRLPQCAPQAGFAVDVWSALQTGYHHLHQLFTGVKSIMYNSTVVCHLSLSVTTGHWQSPKPSTLYTKLSMSKYQLMALKPSTVSSRKQTGKLLVPHTQAHTHTHTRMHEHAHTHAHTHTHSATPSSPLLSMSGTPFLPPPSSAISLDIFKCCVEGWGSFQILQAFNTP